MKLKENILSFLKNFFIFQGILFLLFLVIVSSPNTQLKKKDSSRVQEISLKKSDNTKKILNRTEEEIRKKLLCRVELMTDSKWIPFDIKHGTGDYFVSNRTHCEAISLSVLNQLNKKPRVWSFLIKEHKVKMSLKTLKSRPLQDLSSKALIAAHKKIPFESENYFSQDFNKHGVKSNKLKVHSIVR